MPAAAGADIFIGWLSHMTAGKTRYKALNAFVLCEIRLSAPKAATGKGSDLIVFFMDHGIIRCLHLMNNLQSIDLITISRLSKHSTQKLAGGTRPILMGFVPECDTVFE